MKLLAPLALAVLFLTAPARADIPPPDATNGTDTSVPTDTSTPADTVVVTDTTATTDTGTATTKEDDGCSAGGTPLALALLGLAGLARRRS
ncbi:MAG: hypothetical protein IT385_25745 [Deltaproteobacteria bacterium]|nr:hypothetical protein [Deltaproteobacteria bacterium]